MALLKLKFSIFFQQYIFKQDILYFIIVNDCIFIDYHSALFDSLIENWAESRLNFLGFSRVYVRSGNSYMPGTEWLTDVE